MGRWIDRWRKGARTHRHEFCVSHEGDHAWPLPYAHAHSTARPALCAYVYVLSRLIYILVYIYIYRERERESTGHAPLPREAQAVKYAVGVTMAYSSLWRTRLWRLDYGVDHGVL